MKTWLKEQLVLAACLLPGAILSLRNDLSRKNVFRVVVGFVITILAQKIRGAAIRQQEQDAKMLKLHQLHLPALPCAATIESWSYLCQFLTWSLALSAAPDGWAAAALIPPLLYVQGYSQYRQLRLVWQGHKDMERHEQRLKEKMGGGGRM